MLTVTDKQAGVAKLLDWPKKWTGQSLNVKLQENSYKKSFKALPVKTQWLQSLQGEQCDPSPGQIELKAYTLKLLYWNNSMLVGNVFKALKLLPWHVENGLYFRPFLYSKVLYVVSILNYFLFQVACLNHKLLWCFEI